MISRELGLVENCAELLVLCERMCSVPEYGSVICLVVKLSSDCDVTE